MANKLGHALAATALASTMVLGGGCTSSANESLPTMPQTPTRQLLRFSDIKEGVAIDIVITDDEGNTFIYLLELINGSISILDESGDLVYNNALHNNFPQVIDINHNGMSWQLDVRDDGYVSDIPDDSRVGSIDFPAEPTPTEPTPTEP